MSISLSLSLSLPFFAKQHPLVATARFVQTLLLLLLLHVHATKCLHAYRLRNRRRRRRRPTRPFNDDARAVLRERLHDDGTNNLRLLLTSREHRRLPRIASSVYPSRIPFLSSRKKSTQMSGFFSRFFRLK
uniref:Uncharacterized protein n=1 Tax=Sipha flava TaxID=143950 RepID=A0A2S2PZK3_9HEMI